MITKLRAHITQKCKKLNLPTLTILTSGRCSLPADHSFLLTIDTLHHSIVHITHLAVGKCGSPNFIKYLGPVDPNWTREKPDTKHAKNCQEKTHNRSHLPALQQLHIHN